MSTSALQKFFSELTKDGVELPTDIYFPPRTYEKMEASVKFAGYGMQDYPKELHYYFGNYVIKIHKSKCKECGK